MKLGAEPSKFCFLFVIILFKMKNIWPVVRLDYMKGLNIARAVQSKTILIRAQDLICKETGKFNSTFHKIKSAGGVHKFLNFNGKIILSFVIRDDMIRIFTNYEVLIKVLKPNTYTTPDGETYEKETDFSLKEIKRITLETIKLIRAFPEIVPIGHVKGCNTQQIKLHLKLLERLGITTFIFHTGDFFRNNSGEMIQKARHYCSLIKKKSNVLFLYGFGSQKKLTEFSFADGYITYKHIITSGNGRVFEGIAKTRFSNKSAEQVAKENLIQMKVNLLNLQKQTKLFEGGKCLWVVDPEELELIMRD